MSDTPSGDGEPGDLDAGRLLAKATEVAGLADYGDGGFVEPMTVWLHSVVTEGGLSATGLLGLQAEVIGFLVNRLRFEADRQRHPEILDEDVSDPTVILGLARTGSTKLHRMLAADPRSQKLPLWRLMNPAPFPDADPVEPDPRIAVAVAQLSRIQENTDAAASHPMSAHEAEEEYFLLKLTFESMGNMWRAQCPSFVRWWQAQPRQRPYDYLRRMVQYLQWQDGGRRGRPLVLKAPAHTGNPDILLATFPHATLVQTHRDPCVALASSMRLQEISLRMSSEHVDLEALGENQLSYFAGEMARNLQKRDELPQENQIVDVAFRDICNDPIGVVRDIYGHQGKELSPEAEASMVAWERNNPQHKDGRFSYALEDYGMTRDRVEAAFGPYLERFGHLTTGA